MPEQDTAMANGIFMSFKQYIIAQTIILGFIFVCLFLPVLLVNQEYAYSMILGLSPIVLYEGIWLGALKIGSNRKDQGYGLCLLTIPFKLLVVPSLIVAMAIIPGANATMVVMSSFVYFVLFLVPRLFYIQNHFSHEKK